MNATTPGPENPRDQIAILRGVLQRFAQAEHPADFALIKQLLLERIAELEEEVARTHRPAPPSPNRLDLM